MASHRSAICWMHTAASAAVMWENGERIVLDQAAATSNALAINARGHAVGYSLDAGFGRAVMWR